MKHVSDTLPSAYRAPRFLLRDLALFFAVSFVLNAVWEHAHSLLYASYQGGPITEFILLRASVGDAVILTALALPFFFSAYFRKRRFLIVPPALALAAAIELAALPAGRWAYNAHMPLVPLLHIGWTPFVQLGILGYVALRIVVR